MKPPSISPLLSVVALLLLGCSPPNQQVASGLPSWNDGAAKEAIVEFVARVTDPNSPDFVPAQAFVEEFLSTFVEYPPSQPVGSLSVDQVLERLKASQTRGGG